MKDFFLQRLLQRLEKDGNDDLVLIMEFGANCYSTQELSAILHQVSEQKEVAGRWQHRLFLVGFSVSFWIATSFIAAACHARLLSFLLLTMVPISLLLALGGHFYLRRMFPAYRNIHLVASIIQQELDRRKKDASIF
jgi:apolipoprotein N-acyltransferase